MEAGHGKGEHDGASACIKGALACEELKYKDGAISTDVKSIKNPSSSDVTLQ